ncbi:Na+/H+ antiporter NhaC family protein [Campylobacter canadensis]|nr:Na+/H+ antiporter NhaC family protein [Campylobacter canadensis]
MTMLSNPVLISVFIMLLLCVLRFNVFLAVLVSGLLAGMMSAKFSNFSEFFSSLNDVMNNFITGMHANLETSLSYVLVGALAIAVGNSNLTAYLVKIISKYLSNKKALLLITIAFFSCFSQNLIPIHIAFIPILIPPLLSLFNKLKIDRRAVACAITFGITTPYMTMPLGFGLIFANIITKELNNSGVTTVLSEVTSVTPYLFIPMIFGLICSLAFYYKPREYKQLEVKYKDLSNIQFTKKELSVSFGLIITLIMQLLIGSLPLSALLGFLAICLTKGIDYKEINNIFKQGFELMGYVAFIMLIAAGFGSILRASGGISQIVELATILTQNKIIIAFIMMCVGLLITLGIGSSFGTIPIIATLFIPICVEFGFSKEAIIFLIAAAGAVGDTGSPASEATLGVDVGLNADGQNDHIKDVCIPTFIFYNIPLVVIGTIITVLL